jgi:hypothetical protein
MCVSWWRSKNLFVWIRSSWSEDSQASLTVSEDSLINSAQGVRESVLNIRLSTKTRWYCAVVFLIVVPSVGLAQSQTSEKAPRCMSSNDTRIATYRFLATAIYQNDSWGRIERAAEFANALELVFDNSSDCLVEKGISKTEAEKLDNLMDTLIKPIQAYTKQPPDPTAVREAYRQFVDELDSLK